MASSIDPGLLRDLTEAKAAVARHGIVLIRSIETDLEPAIIVEVKDSLASSPKKLAQMTDRELDRLMDRFRRSAMKSATELADLYKRLLTKIGTEDVARLAEDLEGMGQLLAWERMARAVDGVNNILQEKGFGPVEIEDPADVSEEFAIELQEKWPNAFDRFAKLVEEAAKALREQEAEQGLGRLARPKRARKTR